MKSKLFNNNLDEKLIVLVQRYPGLYKPSDKNYKDNAVIKRAWQEIAACLNKRVPECKVRWRTIRDSYRRHTKKNEGDSGSAAVIKSKYNDEKLKFLDEIFHEKSIANNNVTRIEKYGEWFQKEKCDTIDANCDEKSDESYESEQSGETDVTENDENKKQESKTGPEQSDTAGKCGNKRSLPLDCNKVVRKRKTMRTQQAQGGIKDKILDELKRGRKEHLDFMQNMLRKDDKEEPEHSVETFFKSMSSIVKTFPAHLIAETRLQVCKLITEMEMRSLAETSF